MLTSRLLNELLHRLQSTLLLILKAIVVASFPIGAIAVYLLSLTSGAKGVELTAYIFTAPVAFGISTEPALILYVLIISYAVSLLLFRRTAGKRTASEMLVTYSLVLGLAEAMDAVLSGLGLEAGFLKEENTLRLFAVIAVSPVTEEVGFRLMPIGVALAAAYARSIGEGFRMIIRPTWTERAGEPSKIFVAFLVLVTAFVFGWAHVSYGGGWSVGKFISALPVGAVLGLVYVYRGILYAVLLHWCLNYLPWSYEVARGVIAGLPNIVAYLDVIGILIGLLSLTRYTLRAQLA